jgi:hypothetical protein
LRRDRWACCRPGPSRRCVLGWDARSPASTQSERSLPRRATNDGSLSMTTKLRHMSLDVYAETIAVAKGDGRSTNRRAGSRGFCCGGLPTATGSRLTSRSRSSPVAVLGARDRRGTVCRVGFGRRSGFARRFSARYGPTLLVARLGRYRFLIDRSQVRVLPREPFFSGAIL